MDEAKLAEQIATLQRKVERLEAVESELKATRDELRQALRRQEAIFEGSRDGIVISDLDDRLIAVNAAACELSGYSREEVLGGRAFDFMDPAQWKKLNADRPRLIAGEPLTHEISLRRKDGTYIELESSSRLVWIDKTAHIHTTLRDITRRKHAEAALRDNEERFRQMAENIQKVLWMADPQMNRMFYVSPAYEEIWGRTCEDLYADPRSWLDAVHPDDRARVEGALKEKRVGRYAIEYRIIRSDGAIRWIWDHGFPIRDEAGELCRMAGIAEDITDRKRAEDALRNSEERFRSYFELGLIGMAITSPTKDIVDVNDEMCRILGYERSELLRRTWAELTYPDDLAADVAQFNRVLAGQMDSYSLDKRWVRKDGRVIDATISVKCLRRPDGSVDYFVAMLQDITERKRAEEALRASESQFRSIFENSALGMAMTGLKGQILETNLSLQKMLGYTGEELRRLCIDDITALEDMCLERAMVCEIMEGKLDVCRIQKRYVRKDGGLVWAHLTVSLVRGSHGVPQFAIGMVEDITERRRVETELAEYRDKMMRAEQLASIGTLGATFAHQINQPLTAIRLFLQQSLRELDKVQCPRLVRSNLEDSLKEVSNAITVIANFLRFARRPSETAMSHVHLQDIARRTVNVLAESARRAKMELVIHSLDTLPPLFAHAGDIEQIFFILVQNAIHAAQVNNGGWLTIQGKTGDGWIELQFADTCGGVAPENTDRIFEPFFTTKPPGQGTGLGLCVLQRILYQYDGKVRCESRWGEGTTFFVSLPIQKSEA